MNGVWTIIHRREHVHMATVNAPENTDREYLCRLYCRSVGLPVEQYNAFQAYWCPITEWETLSQVDLPFCEMQAVGI